MNKPVFFLGALMLCSGFGTGAIPEEVLIQFKGIKRVLEQADAAYYKEQRSEMSDEAYEYLRSYHDQLLDEFKELARLEVSVFVDDASKQKVPHRKPVLSLKKAYSDEEVVRFCERVGQEQLFLLEPKIDGASIVIEYQNGRLSKALTRGNSLKGVDVTTVLLASGALPLVIEDSPDFLRLRGEAYVGKEDFARLNGERKTSGEPLFCSARNTAAGTLMLKDYLKIRGRNLQVCIFDVLNAPDLGYVSDFESLRMVQGLGLPIVAIQQVSAVEDLLSLIANENRKRSELPYDTDGFVIKVDRLEVRRLLGNTDKYPRWAIARKFRSEPVVTTVLAIEYSQSDQGKMTPVAILRPITIGGAMVERASLHSDTFMDAMGVKVGQRVKVIRAGGAVPEIVGVVGG